VQPYTFGLIAIFVLPTEHSKKQTISTLSTGFSTEKTTFVLLLIFFSTENHHFLAKKAVLSTQHGTPIAPYFSMNATA